MRAPFAFASVAAWAFSAAAEEPCGIHGTCAAAGSSMLQMHSEGIATANIREDTEKQMHSEEAELLHSEGIATANIREDTEKQMHSEEAELLHSEGIATANIREDPHSEESRPANATCKEYGVGSVDEDLPCGLLTLVNFSNVSKSLLNHNAAIEQHFSEQCHAKGYGEEVCYWILNQVFQGTDAATEESFCAELQELVALHWCHFEAQGGKLENALLQRRGGGARQQAQGKLATALLQRRGSGAQQQVALDASINSKASR